jgi:uncharacterized protein (TIGR02757 family)
MKTPDTATLLNQYYEQFDQSAFITGDPIQIPHRYPRLQDIEIAGFFAAVLAWGQRSTIIHNASRLMELMDDSPYQFIMQHQDEDLRRMEGFCHRTFNDTDLLYCIAFFKWYYSQHDTLEYAFAQHLSPSDTHVGNALTGFHELFFSMDDYPARTRKHIATPLRKSACKRLNMYLRWMVRRDKHGVDFGLWQCISPAQLLCPLDVHVDRYARRLGLLHRKQSDWLAVLELTDALRALDPIDPVRYDFALFGMSVADKKKPRLDR